MPDSAIQDVICCVGFPVAGNPTQFMFQRALSDLQLDWFCLTLEVRPEDLEDAIRGVRAFRFKGVNVNHPHRLAAVPLLDELSDSAQLIGAVNCIRCVENRLIGENTDGQGFLQSLREICPVAEQRVMLLGAGGTARAIAVELAHAGVAKIVVANRTLDHAEDLVRMLSEKLSVEAEAIPWDESLEVSDETEILINATPLGALDVDAAMPLRFDSLKPPLVVADVVVNPPLTQLLIEAADRGCEVLNGLGMLVNQAVMDLKIWTGREPDAAVMREAVEEFLEV